MMNESLLTFTQALQLVGLAPCVLLIIYLLSVARERRSVLVPVIFFFLLSAQFLDVLLPAFFPVRYDSWMKGAFFLSYNTLPALAYLFIIQCAINRVPPLHYWLVLLVPFTATLPYTYATVNTGELCLSMVDCFSAESAMILNRSVINLFVFLLLTASVIRLAPHIEKSSTTHTHRYVLILTLVSMNVILLGIDLSIVAKKISQADYVFISTIAKLVFIYCAMVSVFQLFAGAFSVPEVKMLPSDPELSAREQALADQVLRLLEQDKIYTDIELNRERLAAQLNLKIHQLSRIVNRRFEKSVNELINEYRIREAKRRLEETSEPITAIAYDSGFGSLSTFNRVFKEKCRVSPTDYRTHYLNGLGLPLKHLG